MYETIKSCVRVSDHLSDLFSSLSGVRQGENLSPVSFSLFLNDMNSFLSQRFEGLISCLTVLVILSTQMILKFNNITTKKIFF
jgi:hypothetical protein